VSIFLGTV